MVYILSISIIVLTIIVINLDIIIKEIRSTIKSYRILLLCEIILLIALTCINVFSGKVLIKEKDPNTHKTLKSAVLKEGDSYTYYIERIWDNNVKANEIKENKQEDEINQIIQTSEKSIISNESEEQTIYIHKIDIDKVYITDTTRNEENVKEYRYGTGFTYYGTQADLCGNFITFNRPYTINLIIVCLGIFILDIIVTIMIRIIRKVKKK